MNNIVHNQPMKTFTVIAYILADGGHYVESAEASDATAAAVLLREKLRLKPNDFEVVAVIPGKPVFETVDHTKVALAPYSPAQLGESDQE